MRYCCSGPRPSGGPWPIVATAFAVLALVLPTAAPALDEPALVARLRAVCNQVSAPPPPNLEAEVERLSYLHSTNRPGLAELADWTERPGAMRLAGPPFWRQRQRLRHGPLVWSCRLETPGGGGEVSLLDPGAFRLTGSREVGTGGKIELTFLSTQAPDHRVRVTLDAATYRPRVVEQELLAAWEVGGRRLVSWRQTLHLAARGGLLLVAQGLETYRWRDVATAASPGEGGDQLAAEYQVERRWKALAWRLAPVESPPSALSSR